MILIIIFSTKTLLISSYNYTWMGAITTSKTHCQNVTKKFPQFEIFAVKQLKFYFYTKEKCISWLKNCTRTYNITYSVTRYIQLAMINFYSSSYWNKTFHTKNTWNTQTIKQGQHIILFLRRKEFSENYRVALNLDKTGKCDAQFSRY